MNTILHIINKPLRQTGNGGCDPDLVGLEDGLLFIEDGVYNVLSTNRGNTRLDDFDSTIYALLPDLQLRGFDQWSVCDGVRLVDYRDFVDLTVKYDLTQSW